MAIGWRLRPLMGSSWWLGAALAVVSLVPLGLLDGAGGRHPLNDGTVFLGVAFGFLIAVSVLSHRALHRALSHPVVDEHAEETAAGEHGRHTR